MSTDAVMNWVLPTLPWLPKEVAFNTALPGIAPMAVSDWLLRDDAFAAQMAERDRMISHERDLVLRSRPGSEAAVSELLALVVDALDDGYDFSPRDIRRPDGVTVMRAGGEPLECLGRLVQEDFCLLARNDAGEWQLQAAVLCFPAYWRLDEKIGHGLSRIHAPFAQYDDSIARRVTRLFDGIQKNSILWRYNAHLARDAELFKVKSEFEEQPLACPGQGSYLRSERQTLRRLPDTGWVVFGIHTGIMPFAALSPAQAAGFSSTS